MQHCMIHTNIQNMAELPVLPAPLKKCREWGSLGTRRRFATHGFGNLHSTNEPPFVMLKLIRGSLSSFVEYEGLLNFQF